MADIKYGHPVSSIAPDCSKTSLLTPEETLPAAGEDGAGESKADEHPKGNSKVSLRACHLVIIGAQLLPQRYRKANLICGDSSKCAN